MADFPANEFAIGLPASGDFDPVAAQFLVPWPPGSTYRPLPERGLMTLQGRKLSIGTRGSDVRALHKALRQLGYELPVDERQNETFGDRLSRNQQFEEALRWFNRIFDPLDPAGRWRFRPFTKLQDHPAEELMALLHYTDNNPTFVEARKALEDQIEEWKDNPFNPHLLARHRLNAYMYNVRMKFMDNLIAWGDQLFGLDTIESINQATQLYILAAEILGRKPEAFPPRATAAPKTFLELRSVGLDKFSNALVKLEGWAGN